MLVWASAQCHHLGTFLGKITAKNQKKKSKFQAIPNFLWLCACAVEGFYQRKYTGNRSVDQYS